MMRKLFQWSFIFLISASPIAADVVVAAGTIRSQQIIGPDDVVISDAVVPGALSEVALAIGLEARINIYPGRPVRPGDLQAPAVVDRNEFVTLQYSSGGLVILTEGRSLDRAGMGERLRVQNLSSRATVTGVVAGPGLVLVGGNQ